MSGFLFPEEEAPSPLRRGSGPGGRMALGSDSAPADAGGGSPIRRSAPTQAAATAAVAGGAAGDGGGDSQRESRAAVATARRRAPSHQGLGGGGAIRSVVDRAKGYPTDRIYYDTEGNLRVVLQHHRSRMEELRRVLAADDTVGNMGESAQKRNKKNSGAGKEEKEGDETDEAKEEAQGPDTNTWYLIDTKWVRHWLKFVHHKTYIHPPGPVNQMPLLVLDVDEARWLPRPDLNHVADRKRTPSYRRVNQAVWEVYKDMYGVEGPEITVPGEPYNEVDRWEIRHGPEFDDLLREIKESGILAPSNTVFTMHDRDSEGNGGNPAGAGGAEGDADDSTQSSLFGDRRRTKKQRRTIRTFHRRGKPPVILYFTPGLEQHGSVRRTGASPSSPQPAAGHVATGGPRLLMGGASLISSHSPPPATQKPTTSGTRRLSQRAAAENEGAAAAAATAATPAGAATVATTSSSNLLADKEAGHRDSAADPDFVGDLL